MSRVRALQIARIVLNNSMQNFPCSVSFSDRLEAYNVLAELHKELSEGGDES